MENLLLGLTPVNFLKFDIFPGDSSNPQPDTETGYIYVERVIASESYKLSQEQWYFAQINRKPFASQITHKM